MGPIFLTLLVLVLSCSSSCGIELDQNRDGVEWAQNGEIKTELVDMNADVLYLILYRLEIKTLVNMVQVDSGYEDIIDIVIRQKYRNHHLYIEYNLNPASIYEETGDDIKIHDIPLALNILKYFGHNFQSIKIHDEHMELVDLANICQFISKYCSKSLKTLRLVPRKYDILENFMEPFEAVEELNIYYIMTDNNESYVSAAEPRLNELFPNLRRFELQSLHTLNYSFINCELPHIEHVHIFPIFRNSLSGSDSENVNGFIEKNPTIRSLEIHFRDPNVITSISKYLPQLENLTLAGLDIGNDTVELGNVKNFLFLHHYFPHFAIDKLSMPRLESLYTKYDPTYFNQWMSFFNNHTQLRHLHLHYLSNAGSMHLNELTANLINLTDVTIESNGHETADIEIQFIDRIIKNHQKLNKFQLAIEPFRLDEIRPLLRERFGREWNIEQFQLKDKEGISIERKQPIVG